MPLPAETTAKPVALIVPLTLIACTGVSILSTDLYTPSLPHLPALLHSDAVTVQLTMSLNLMAYALAQLAHGPLADRFGRRRVLLGGLAGFLLASLACVVASSIHELIAGRIAQGVFGSVQSVVVLVMIRELYGGARAVRITGYYGMAIGLVPTVAPLLGGYVFIYAGWQANFLLLSMIAGAVLAMTFFHVPETLPPPYRRIGIGALLWAYLQLLCMPAYLRYLLPMAAIFAGLFAFITAGPFVLIERLGVATQHYGYYFGIVVLAFIAGSFCASRLASRRSARQLVAAAVLTSLLGGLGLLLPILMGYETLALIVGAMSVYAFGIGLILAGGPTALFDAVGHRPLGAAAAMAGAVEMGMAALASLLVGLFYDGTALPMAVICAVMAATAALAFFGLSDRASAR